VIIIKRNNKDSIYINDNFFWYEKWLFINVKKILKRNYCKIQIYSKLNIYVAKNNPIVRGKTLNVEPIHFDEHRYSFKRLFRLTVQRFHFLILSLLVGLLASSIYIFSPLMPAPSYTASGSVAYKVTTNTTVLTTITEIATSQAVAEQAALTLITNNITLENGTILTAAMIRQFTESTFSANSLKVSIHFTYQDSTIIIPTVNAIIDATIAIGNANYTIINQNLTLGDYADSFVTQGPSNNLITLLFLISSLLIGGSIFVLYDFFKGTITHHEDLKEFKIPTVPLQPRITHTSIHSFVQSYVKKNLQKDEEVIRLYEQDSSIDLPLLHLENNAESHLQSIQEATVMLITSPLPTEKKSHVALKLAKLHSQHQLKTLIIDFDFYHPHLTNLLSPNSQGPLEVSLFSDLIYKVEYIHDYLAFLPCEPRPYHARFLKSQDVLDLFIQAKRDYDHIIIIGPSVLSGPLYKTLKAFSKDVLIVSAAHQHKLSDTLKAYNELLTLDFQSIQSIVVRPPIHLFKVDVSFTISNA
jgi:Mrp family chromosome partitioning ATPase